MGRGSTEEEDMMVDNTFDPNQKIINIIVKSLITPKLYYSYMPSLTY
jgi:hypothetical protein